MAGRAAGGSTGGSRGRLDAAVRHGGWTGGGGRPLWTRRGGRVVPPARRRAAAVPPPTLPSCRFLPLPSRLPAHAAAAVGGESAAGGGARSRPARLPRRVLNPDAQLPPSTPARAFRFAGAPLRPGVLVEPLPRGCARPPGSSFAVYGCGRARSYSHGALRVAPLPPTPSGVVAATGVVPNAAPNSSRGHLAPHPLAFLGRLLFPMSVHTLFTPFLLFWTAKSPELSSNMGIHYLDIT